jgi:hypothetical protein
MLPQLLIVFQTSALSHSNFLQTAIPTAWRVDCWQLLGDETLHDEIFKVAHN